MKLEAVCPYCHARYGVTEALVGREVHCRKSGCGRMFVVAPNSPPPEAISFAEAPPAIAGVPPIATPPLPVGGKTGSAVVPPPLPVTSVPPSLTPLIPGGDASKGVDELLVEYRMGAKRAGPRWVERLKGGWTVVRQRARALQLQHQFKGIEGAVQGQLENLGALTLAQQPAQLDLAAEIAELSTLQDYLTKQQATLNSLQQTKGSQSVVRDLNRQLAQRRERQQQVMIAIGAKADTSRPAMPDASGVYSAIDQLRTTAQSIRLELQALEQAIGAVGGGKASIAALKKPAWIAGGVGAVLVVSCLVWVLVSRFFTGGIPSWAAACVPSNAQRVAYVNLDRVRKSDLYKDLEAQFQGGSWADDFGGLRLRPDDVREIVLTSPGRSGDDIVILRTHADLPLDDVVAKQNRSAKSTTYKGFEYVRASSGYYAAKIARRIYCVAPKEDIIKDVLDRAEKKERPKLDRELKRILDNVGSGDLFMAESDAASSPFGGMLPDFPDFEAVGIAAWIGSRLSVQGLIGFTKERGAEEVVKEFDKMMKKASSEDSGPFQGKEGKKIVELVSQLKLRQRGKDVLFKGAWKVSDIQEITSGIAKNKPSRRRSL
jgi:hypothetical protein